MYKCQITGKLSRRGDPRTGELFHIGEVKQDESVHAPEKCHRIVVETRAKSYKHWDRENEEEWFSHGTEIVREVNACEEGKKLWDSWTPEQRDAWVKARFHPGS